MAHVGQKIALGKIGGLGRIARGGTSNVLLAVPRDDPHSARVVLKRLYTHLAENDNHGGGVDPDLPDPKKLPDGPAITSPVDIVNYEYTPTDLDLATSVATVQAGQPITFNNLDAPASGYGTWHSITSCALPCNKSTGIAYPLADGKVEFDSGQLGNFGQPTAGKLTWDTPSNLTPGTYSFFCRVHPFMRGAFRVVPTAG